MDAKKSVRLDNTCFRNVIQSSSTGDAHFWLNNICMIFCFSYRISRYRQAYAQFTTFCRAKITTPYQLIAMRPIVTLVLFFFWQWQHSCQVSPQHKFTAKVTQEPYKNAPSTVLIPSGRARICVIALLIEKNVMITVTMTSVNAWRIASIAYSASMMNATQQVYVYLQNMHIYCTT